MSFGSEILWRNYNTVSKKQIKPPLRDGTIILWVCISLFSVVRKKVTGLGYKGSVPLQTTKTKTKNCRLPWQHLCSSFFWSIWIKSKDLWGSWFTTSFLRGYKNIHTCIQNTYQRTNRGELKPQKLVLPLLLCQQCPTNNYQGHPCRRVWV